MKFIQDILSQDMIHTIGWTLVHSIWQGSLITLATGLLMWMLHRQSAKLRYFCALSAMLLVFVVAAGTFIYLYQQPPSVQLSGINESSIILSEDIISPVVAAPYSLSADASTVSADPNFWSKMNLYFHRHMPLIVVIWLVGVVLFSLRMIGGIAYVQRLKHYRVAAVEDLWQKRLSRLAGRLGVRKSVQLLESAMVKTPVVIGHLKPVILLPAGILTGLPPEQIEVILAHELAHIRRNDYLVNMLQKLLELLFFYHPAVWWLSAMVRTEREHCCDDLAVRVSGDSLTFAKALVGIQEMGLGTPAMAMNFAGKKKRILWRINRLLKGAHFEFSATEGIIMTCIVVFGIFLIHLNANAKFEPHEAVEFLGGGIDNTSQINSSDLTPDAEPDFPEEAPVEKPDTTILPSETQTPPVPDPNPDVFTDVIPPDSMPPSVSIMSADMYTTGIIQIDSLIQGIMATPPAITLTPFLADTIIKEQLRTRPARPSVPALAFNVGMRGGYVPITERFHNVTGTFTINYEEEDRKYKTIRLTTEKGKVTSLEVNGEKINAIAIDAMIAEIDREGRKFASSQWMYQFQNEDNAFRNFRGDSTFHWKGGGFEWSDEWEEKLEEQMKLQEEHIERNMENLRQFQEDALERQERQRQRMEERMRENEARMEEQKLKMQAQRIEHQQQDEIIIDELFRDKLIESKDEVKLEINKKRMLINGKKQPAKVLEKYIDLIEDIKGLPIEEDRNFTLMYSADEK